MRGISYQRARTRRAPSGALSRCPGVEPVEAFLTRDRDRLRRVIPPVPEGGLVRDLRSGTAMGRADKILSQMETNPRGWRYEEVASLLRSFGFTERKGATSHRQWIHP